MKINKDAIPTGFIGLQVALMAMAIVLYKCFGALLVKTAHQGIYIPFLSSIMASRLEVPISNYLDKADYLFTKYFVYFIFFVFCEFMALLAIKAKTRKNRIFSVVFLLAGLYLWRYEHFVNNLYKHEHFNIATYEDREGDFPKITLAQLTQLAWAHKEDASPDRSYIEFSENKKPGITRIGVFGCSLVAGAEAAKGSEFPSFLQERVDKAGIKNVEIINFGVSSYGMHQSFLLWEYLGREYGLDYAIFMPFSFQIKRDQRFVATNLYGPVHARYIIENNELKLVPVVGLTRAEAARIFNRLIHPWRYVRYSYQMPLFLRVLLPPTLYDRFNPFYYRGPLSNKKEMLATYAMIFNKLAKEAENVIIIADNDIYNLRKNCASPNVYFLKGQANHLIPTNENLYHAVRWHKSAMGNKLIADELFSLLTGKTKPEINVIELCYIPNYKKIKSFSASTPLCKYENITVNIAGYPVTSFISFHRHSEEAMVGKPFDFKKHKTASLCLLETQDARRAQFIPLAFLLKDEDPVTISFKMNNRNMQFSVGEVDAPAPYFGRIAPKLDKVKSLIGPKDRVKDIFVKIGNKKILKGAYKRENKAFVFEPVELKFVYMRAKEGQFIDVDTISEKEGTLDLVVRDKDGNEERCPMLSYKVSPAKTLAFDQAYRQPAIRIY